MKLRIFKASTNQKAMAMVLEAFGEDALIYNTRSITDGVEILAGPSEDEQESVLVNGNHLASMNTKNDSEPQVAINEAQNVTVESLDAMKQQINALTQTVDSLSRQIHTRYLDMFHMSDDEKTIKRNYLYYYLNKLGFRGNFCHQFANQYLNARKVHEDIDDTKIQSALLRSIKTGEFDLGDEKITCALVGPTGVGKTTTIAKLANRYIASNGPAGLGLITTDFNDITGKNRLLNYSWLINVPVEYVETAQELSQVLNQMRDKKLILIDTHGVGQRNADQIATLLDLLESQGSRVQICLAMPANVQEAVLDEIARAYSSPNLHSCILTKQDECISIASALGVCLNYKMRISYICDGQDINTDLHAADARQLMHQIISEAANLKKMTEENLFKSTERVEQAPRKRKSASLSIRV